MLKILLNKFSNYTFKMVKKLMSCLFYHVWTLKKSFIISNGVS